MFVGLGGRRNLPLPCSSGSGSRAGRTVQLILYGRQNQSKVFIKSVFSINSSLSSLREESSVSKNQRNEAVSLKFTEFSHSSLLDTTSTSLKPPAIFLHGLLGNKRNFATIGRSLSVQLKHSRRLFGLDLRNHGDNYHDWREDMSYQAMAQDVIHFLDKNNFNKAELIGHSVGGKVAQAVALMIPDRIVGLVVIDIAPVTYTSDEPHWKAVVDVIESLVSAKLTPGMSKREVDMKLQSKIPDPALRSFCLTNYDQTAGEWKIHLQSIASQLESLAGFEVECSKRSYVGDTFFIHGGQSRFVRHKHINTIAELFPNHMLTTIRGAGHWVHAEAPEDTTSLLRKFLDR